MKVFQISLKIFLLEDVNLCDSLWKIGSFIDGGLVKIPELLEFHEKNTYKNYCFANMYPFVVKDKIYKKNNIYTIVIRTIDGKLANFFNNKLLDHSNSVMKGLTTEIKVIPKRFIDKIYSLTPVIIKNDQGYWKNCLSLEEYENRLKINLVKKYNMITEDKCDEDFKLYTAIKFDNNKPVSIAYKNDISLLGDKLTLNISDDKMAQELAYMSLGTGIGEFNPRGAGFVNYKFL